LGSSVELDPRFEAPTLWGTTAFIGEELTRLETVVHEARGEVDMATAAAKNVADIVAKAQEDKVKETEKLREILSFVIGRAQALGLDLDTVKVKVAQMSTEIKRSPSKPGPSKKQRINPTANGDHSKMDDILNLLSATRSPQSIPEEDESTADDDDDEEAEQKRVLPPYPSNWSHSSRTWEC
jgi:hypothetical protein